MHRLAAMVTAVATGIAVVFVLLSVDFGKILTTLHQLRPATIAAATFFLIINLLFAFFRFERTLAAFGAFISWRTAAYAFSLSTLASQFLLNIIGQSLSRAMVLQSAGIPMGLTVIATYVERLIALGILGIFAIIAALVLFGSIGFNLQEGGAYFISLGIGLSLVLGLVAVRAFAAVVTREHLHRIAAIAVRLIPALGLSVLVFAAMFAAYYVLAADFAAGVPVAKLAAAILVVMFAASIPISWAGWGLREFGAVYALSAVGMSSEAAVIIAVTVGTLSLLVTLAVGCVAAIEGWRRPAVQPASEQPPPAELPAANTVLFWTSGILAACLIYFQLRVPTGADVITANIADPLALTAFFFAAYLALKEDFLKHFPRWVLRALLILAAALVTGALVAWLNLGLTQWALLNRMLGFLILLGYAAIPGLVVRTAGDRGGRILANAFIASALLICAIEVAAYIVHLYVVPLPVDFFGYQFKIEGQLEGYAQNPNAFAFQLLVAVSVLIAFHRPDFQRSSAPWSLLAIAAFLAVVVIGRSRAGILSGFVLGLLTIVFMYFPSGIAMTRKQIAIGAIVLSLVAVAGVAFHSFDHSLIETFYARWRPNASASDVLRWQTTTAGLQQWLQHPLFGYGLGSYYLESQRAGSAVVVIHSVPIWFLAEMGLIGLGAYVFFVATLLNWGLAEGGNIARKRGVLALLALFVLMGLVHDVFFQRTFWFAMGLMLIDPLTDRS